MPRSGSQRQLELYTCPKCQVRESMEPIASSARGRKLYECTACKHRATDGELEVEYSNRPLRD
jgi:ribosomal protein L37AE/L43A